MSQIHDALHLLFSELTAGADRPGGAYMLNTGDVGLLKSLERLSAADASESTSGGATIAAHAQHLRYGISLMNRWFRDGGDPFMDATWEEAWKTTAVTDAQWSEIRAGLAEEVSEWTQHLAAPRALSQHELTGMMGSVAHLAYHLGAIRQIARSTRGPREGMHGSTNPERDEAPRRQ